MRGSPRQSDLKRLRCWGFGGTPFAFSVGTLTVYARTEANQMSRNWILVAGALLVLPVGAHAQQSMRGGRDRVRERIERPMPSAQNRCIAPDRVRRTQAQRDRTGQRSRAGSRTGQARLTPRPGTQARPRPAPQAGPTPRPRLQGGPRPSPGRTADRARFNADRTVTASRRPTLRMRPSCGLGESPRGVPQRVQ